MIALSRSINRHSLLVKSNHCAAFADWSTLEEKVDFLAVGCSYLLSVDTSVVENQENEKIYFWPGERAMQTLIIMKKKSDNNSSSCDTFWRWPWVSWWWWWWYFWAAGTQNFSRWGCCCCFYHCFDKKKDCESSLPGDLLGTDRVHQALWGPHSLHNHHSGNPTATTTHPQLMLIFN